MAFCSFKKNNNFILIPFIQNYEVLDINLYVWSFNWMKRRKKKQQQFLVSTWKWNDGKIDENKNSEEKKIIIIISRGQLFIFWVSRNGNMFLKIVRDIRIYDKFFWCDNAVEYFNLISTELLERIYCCCDSKTCSLDWR